jgi:hypothetical protein
MPHKRAATKSDLHLLYSRLEHTSWDEALGEGANLRLAQIHLNSLRNRVVHASADVGWDAVLGPLTIADTKQAKQADTVVAKVRPIPPLQVSVGVARAVGWVAPPRFPKFLLLLIP